jgi:hypothetical protein
MTELRVEEHPIAASVPPAQLQTLIPTLHGIGRSHRPSYRP